MIGIALIHDTSAGEYRQSARFAAACLPKRNNRAVHREAALRLLEAGARADIADARGCTPLHCAVMAGTEEVVEALLARGAASDVATTRAVRDLDIRANERPRDLAVRRARLTQLQAVETILRAFGVPVGEVGRFCARTAPNEDGAWEAAAAHAESVGDRSAANRVREPNCREDIDTSKMTEHKLVLEDQKLGALDSVLDHEGISIVEHNNDDEVTFTRYVFALR